MPPEPGTSGFADLLRTLRRARGWTQEELAAKARVGVRTLRDLERARARPQRATADLLAAALGLDDPQRTEFTRAARHGAGTDLLVEGRGISLPQPPGLIGRPALLLVDAVDRAAEPTGAALRWLQGHLPALRLLATGRHPTGITGEYVWPVDPLEPPPPGLTDPAEIARYPAARLFLDRLREVGLAEVGASDAMAVAELVRRLGGLPLALELAAARGRVLAGPG